MFKVLVSRTDAEIYERDDLVSGQVNSVFVRATFSPAWEGFTKMAVFTNGVKTRDVIPNGDSFTVPWEVLAEEGKTVRVGFYGYKVEGGVKLEAIPTVYAELGTVRSGADTSCDPSMAIETTVAEQLAADIDALDGRVDGAEAMIADHEERITELEEHGGASDYPDLTNKPSINGVELVGNKTSEELGIDIPTELAELSDDATHRTVTDAEKAAWNAKQSAIDDLATIRSNASAGATAVQPSNYATTAKGGVIKTGLGTSIGTGINEGKLIANVQSESDFNDMSNYGFVSKGALNTLLSKYRTASGQNTIDNSKVDKVTGKGLSTNDYTDADKALVAGALQSDDVIEGETVPLPAVPTELAELAEDSTHRTVTDAEKTAWSAKADKPAIESTMDAVAVVNTMYFLGVQSAVSVVLPSNAEAGQQISVVWYNGATAATLTVTGTVLTVDYAPSANSRSELNAMWDGTYWAVVTNEQAVTA